MGSAPMLAIFAALCTELTRSGSIAACSWDSVRAMRATIGVSDSASVFSPVQRDFSTGDCDSNRGAEALLSSLVRSRWPIATNPTKQQHEQAGVRFTIAASSHRHAHAGPQFFRKNLKPEAKPPSTQTPVPIASKHTFRLPTQTGQLYIKPSY